MFYISLRPFLYTNIVLPYKNPSCLICTYNSLKSACSVSADKEKVALSNKINLAFYFKSPLAIKISLISSCDKSL